MTTPSASNQTGIIASSLKKLGPPPPAITARYWRIAVLENASGGSIAAISAAEIEMRAAAGGADQCVGGTPSVSSSSSGSAASNFDNNSTTFWASVNTNYGTHWVSYDFITPVSVVEVSWSKRPDSFGTNEAPTYALVQYSNNNILWTTDWTFSTRGNWATGAETRVFNKKDAPFVDINWRISVEANAFSEFTVPAGVAIAEIEMRTVAGGSDECSGGVSSGSGSGGTTSNAFDNNLGTIWNPSGTLPIVIQYSFPLSRNIIEFSLTARNDTFIGDTPTVFKLQRKDGLTNDIMTFKTGPWGPGETRIFNINNYVEEPAKFIRLRPTGIHGNSSFRFSLSRIEFRTSLGGSTICVGGVAFARDFSSGTSPANAFDSTLSSRYAARLTGGHPNNYIGYHLTSAIADQVIQIAYTATNETFGPSESPTGFHVEYGVGNVWTNLWTESGIPAWTAGETRLFNKP